MQSRPSQIVLYMGHGDWREARFNIGEQVMWEEWAGPQIVAGVTIYPSTEYFFAYWLQPAEGAHVIGHDIPEDELELYENRPNE